MLITMTRYKILRVFFKDKERELAGCDIMRQTGLKSGALYPALHALEEGGILQSRWERVKKGPRRRYYSLKNKKQAKELVDI